MTEINKVPAIRFIAFGSEWVEQELGEIAEFNPKSELPDVFEYVDLESVVGTEIIAHRVENKATAPSRAKRLARKGDLFFQTVRPYQRNNHLFSKPCQNYVFSTGYAQLRPQVDGYFLLSLVQKEAFVKSVLDRCTGTSYPAINSDTLAEIVNRVPLKLKEQSQIGSFFQNLDSLITLRQQKYAKLATVKKAMLEKMFPKDGADASEIRFKEFAEKWEKRQLGEIVSEEKRPIELKDEHEYELVTVKRRNEGVVSRGKLRGKDILVKNYYEVRTGDYVISKRQVVHGANGVVPQSLDKAIVSNEYLVAIGNERITTDFFALLSKRPHMYKKFFLSSYGVDIEKLVFDVDDWKKRYVYVPCPAEQQRISSFFQNLDSLITLQLRELDKLKNIKKACLDKMFV